MNRLTQKRVNGIKTGYWSTSKKDDLVARLAEYENTGLEPEEVLRLKKDMPGLIPVTEKLPKEDAWVLVAVKRHHWISDFGEENMPDDEKTDHPERIYYALGRCLMRDSWEYLDLESDDESPCVSATDDCSVEDLSYPFAEVIAWMPLPEPYREVMW